MSVRQRFRRPGRAALALAGATASLVLVTPGAQAAPKTAPQSFAPVLDCDAASFAGLGLANTTVTAAVRDAGDATTPASCRVALSVDDPEDTGVVTVWVYLPEDTWNGRFQGVGGGGFSGGDPGRLLDPLRAGYAAAATDAGHQGGSGTFALNSDGTLNWPAIEDFGHEGVHDMTVTAKAVITAFYGQEPAYSYWNGCSTGGRQGLMEAQKYPDDYDGILAGAPVINWPEMQTMQIWGQVVMNQEDNPIHPCKFEAALAATIAACDTVGDGVTDGVIGDPLACDFDLGSLVGTVTPCGAITEDDVAVMRRIAEGPRGTDGDFLWYGLPPGAPYAGLHAVAPQADGSLVQQPFVYDIWWFQYWLTQNPNFDWSTLDYESFEHWFDVAVQRYGDLTGASDPDLSAFRESGGKLLMWHGAADFGVPFQGTVDYYERVRDELGPGHTQQFVRLFLAPGVGHCGGGNGAQLVDPLSALVEWVEGGKAPRTLDAATAAGATRPICLYPFVAQWTGRGDSADGSTYRCVRATTLDPRQP
jgi:Tannase and feruloyl esterase